MKTRFQNTPNDAESRKDGKRRGSALAAVFIICTATAMVAGSALNTATAERRMNQIAALNAEARNAAEAIVDFGLADLQQRFTDHNSFATNELSQTKDPLTLPSTFYTLFSGSRIVMPSNPYDGTLAYGTYSTEIIGGTVPDAGWTFIDSTIPGNEDDELADRNVKVRQVRVYGRATARANSDGTGLAAVAYCRESLQVRDAPLFAYAIFYNMDLEIAPGVAMTITGPVHTNGNLYLAPNPTATTSWLTSAPTGVSLIFTDTVTAVGGIYHTLPTGYSDTGVSGTDMVTGSGKVYFYDDDGNAVSMYQSTRWITSSVSDWLTKSKDLWDENVQDKAYGVRTAKSVAFNSYVADDSSTSATYDALNYAYQLIMPAVNKNITTATTTSPAYDESIEQQKYENKAGIVIVVSTGSIDSSSTVGITGFSIYRQEFDSDGNVVYSGNAPKRTLLCTVSSLTDSTSTTVHDSFFGTPSSSSSSTSSSSTTSSSTTSSTSGNTTTNTTTNTTVTTTTTTNYTYYSTPTGTNTNYANATSSSNNATLTTSSTTSTTGTAATTGTTSSSSTKGSKTTVTVTVTAARADTVTTNYYVYSNSGIFRICNYNGSTSSSTSATVTSGMWDMRRYEGLDIIEIDMCKLRAALLADDAYLWSSSATSTTDSTYSPRAWWNGIIYVEFPYDSSDTVGNDNVRKSADGFGLRLKDATATISGSTYTPGIPGNMTSSTYSSWTNYKSLTGTTVATNGAMYILGSYNADGSSSTGSSTTTDTSDDSTEPAASLAADSITILSSAWLDYYSAYLISSSTSYVHRYTTTFTEVSAAIISGIVPTNKYGADHDSGGVHNLPRFLELWKSTTFCYRGSFVCLYESEIGSPAPYFRTYYSSTTNYIYSPPTRNWGFNEQYSDGIYPPGTPLLRTFKQIDFKYMSAAEWASEISGL